MRQEIFSIFAIVGMVVGSGFVSGKEVVTFFARFGGWSFVAIGLSFFIMFWLFMFVLSFAKQIDEKLQRSKIFKFMNFAICTIFAAAMFGSIVNLLNFHSKTLNFIIFLLILAICCFIFKYGDNFFNKLNLFLVPIMLILFLIVVISKVDVPILTWGESGSLSAVYAVLYCLLNTGNGCAILAGLGKGLNRKQKARVAFISALVLSLILFVTNMVLLSHPNCLTKDMPMLSLFASEGKSILSFVVFLGSATTLFCTIYSSASSIRGMVKNEFLNCLLSVCLPLLLSLWGFGNIVDNLYPIASVMAGAMLVGLLFEFPFKWHHKQIHAGGKQAEDEDAGHHNVKF